MKKYLVREWKKSIAALIVLTAAWSIFCVIHYSTVQLSYEIYDWQTGALKKIVAGNPRLWVYFVPLYLLCMLTPIFTYQFQMDKRSVDYYFSFPLKKEKLYLVKTLVGLSTVIIPFTVAFWSGFLAAAFREGNLWQMGYFVPTYFICLLFAVCIYGIYAFVFTRANKVSDGVAFMIAYTFVFFLIISFFDLSALESKLGRIPHDVVEVCLFFGLMTFSNYATDWIMGTAVTCNAFTFVFPVVLGVIAYFLLFFLLRYQKAENAEQISESPFGYKALIPVYTAFMTALNAAAGGLWLVFCLIGAVIATACYRRKFKFSWQYWLVIVGSMVLGLILSLFL